MRKEQNVEPKEGPPTPAYTALIEKNILHTLQQRGASDPSLDGNRKGEAACARNPRRIYHVTILGSLDAEGRREQRFHGLRSLLGNLSSSRSGENAALQVGETIV